MLDSTIAYGLTFLVPAGDRAIGLSLRLYGEFARPEVDFLLACAGEPGVFIDVGANVGAISLPFARRRPDWRVISIEAHRGLAGLLTANALNNQLYNVEAIHAAAGPKEGLARFPAPPLDASLNFGGVGFGFDAPKETVRMLTLDDLAPPETRLVKIDVEGFEAQVLDGAGGLIESRRAIWLIEAAGRDREARASTIGRFQAAGYDVHWFYAPFATPASPKGKPGNPVVGDVNVVATPPGVTPPWPLQRVQDPGESAPPSVAGYDYLLSYGYAPLTPG